MKTKITVTDSSGNVFADLGLPDADPLPVQAELVRLIYLRVKQLGLTQVAAAKRLGLNQPDVSRLINGRHTGFSAERLFRFLNALDQDIQICVGPKPAGVRRVGRVRVVAA